MEKAERTKAGAKFVFVTGGVVSSLGKGLTAAALGALLEARGLDVGIMKLDPYLNFDAGTMSPEAHGELIVLPDGAETDLDLGHYTRFMTCPLSRANSVTSGQIYTSVIERERRGDYLGQTVQIVPHISDEIKARIREAAAPHQIMIVELGGTVGDMEGLPFLEAFRQMMLEEKAAFSLHLVYVPFLKAAGEAKSKPAQQSCSKLRELGLMPDALVCRCERPLDSALRQKLSLFCNVPAPAVVEEMDVSHTVYELPLVLQKEGLDQLILAKLGLAAPPPRLEAWQRVLAAAKAPRPTLRVALVGKYAGTDAYKSVYQALDHAALSLGVKVQLLRLDAEELETHPDRVEEIMGSSQAVLIPGGFGARGVEGMVLAAGWARTRQIPFLGICLGMQVAVIEAARSLAGLEKANSAEFASGEDEQKETCVNNQQDKQDSFSVNVSSPPLVIDLMLSQQGVTTKGGTMRLGAYACRLEPGTKVNSAYQKWGAGISAPNCEREIKEIHRHRYEVNPKYRPALEKAGLKASAINPEWGLVEMVELEGHAWYVGTQSHPEFLSKPTAPHPLFAGFLEAACLKMRVESE